MTTLDLTMTTKNGARRPAVLCILDGWGLSEETENNAIALAETPNWDRMVVTYPTGYLDASEEHVGLPEGQMGNSEVGHMNLGAGRILMQDLPRIDRAIENGELAENAALLNHVSALKKSGGTCHIMGLLSPGGVHGHQNHMIALARIVAGEGVPVAVHGFLDGRDTPPNSAVEHIADFISVLARLDGANLVSLCGRYYAMDRDKRWARVERAYNLIVDAVGVSKQDAIEAISRSYDAGVRDEFVEPIILEGFAGMKDGDGLLVANFRADRTRQILESLIDPAFEGFHRQRTVAFSTVVGMVEYSRHLNSFAPALFPAERPENVLGQVVSDAGLKQLRIAETEKYAHVTFFLNGGRERLFDGEDRILIPSPNVATYDLCPEMSAVEVTDNLVRVIDEDLYDLIVVNFANGDMVGHSGVLSAAIKAAETVDACLGRLEQAVIVAGGALFVTADHGNCERMSSDDGTMHTAHTLNLVPSILIGVPDVGKDLRPGKLCDVAPTILELMGLPQPVEMTGKSMINARVTGFSSAAAE